MIIELKNAIDNISLQIGDTAYHLDSNGDPSVVGEIVNIGNDWIEVNGGSSLSNGEFIMFSKNKVVNDSGVTGYYADVKLTNSSTSPAELFALSSEVSESSK